MTSCLISGKKKPRGELGVGVKNTTTNNSTNYTNPKRKLVTSLRLKVHLLRRRKGHHFIILRVRAWEQFLINGRWVSGGKGGGETK